MSKNTMRIEKVTIEWKSDECPDLSWLDQTDAEMGEGFETHSSERKASYGSSWEMLGCVAKAEVSYPLGDGCRRLEWLTSGGLYGIESDSDKAYLAEVESEQLQELADHLNRFGINTSAKQLQDLA